VVSFDRPHRFPISVTLQNEIPMGRGNFGVFFDRDAVLDDDSCGPYIPCVRWGTKGRKGHFRGDLAADCKVMGHSTVNCAKTAEPIEMQFWMRTQQVCPCNYELYGGADPQGVQARTGPLVRGRDP